MATTNTKTAGQRIQSAREKQGLDRAQAAKRLKVTAGFYSIVENGHGQISPNLKARIEKLYGMRLSEGEVEAHNAKIRAKAKKARKSASAPKSAKPVAQTSMNLGEPVWTDSDLEATRDQLRAENESLKAKSVVSTKSQRIEKHPSTQATLPGFDLWNEVAQRIADAMIKARLENKKTGTNE